MGLIQHIEGHHLVGIGDGLSNLLEVAEGAQLGAEGIGGGQVSLDSGDILSLSHDNFPFCPAIISAGRRSPADTPEGVSALAVVGEIEGARLWEELGVELGPLFSVLIYPEKFVVLVPVLHFNIKAPADTDGRSGPPVDFQYLDNVLGNLAIEVVFFVVVDRGGADCFVGMRVIVGAVPVSVPPLAQTIDLASKLTV